MQRWLHQALRSTVSVPPRAPSSFTPQRPVAALSRPRAKRGAKAVELEEVLSGSAQESSDLGWKSLCSLGKGPALSFLVWMSVHDLGHQKGTSRRLSHPVWPQTYHSSGSSLQLSHACATAAAPALLVCALCGHCHQLAQLGCLPYALD